MLYMSKVRHDQHCGVCHLPVSLIILMRTLIDMMYYPAPYLNHNILTNPLTPIYPKPQNHILTLKLSFKEVKTSQNVLTSIVE